MEDVHINLCKTSRYFALFNNCICYCIIYIYVNHCIRHCYQYPNDCKKNLVSFYENENTEEKIFSLLSICLLVFVIIMIIVNHKFRSKSKPEFYAIKLWLIVHGVVFHFVLFSFTIPSMFMLKTKYTILLVSTIAGLVLAFEMYLIKHFYDEERLNLSTSIFDLVNKKALPSFRGSGSNQNRGVVVVVSYFLLLYLIVKKKIYSTIGVPNHLTVLD